jgi:hypothetical protein
MGWNKGGIHYPFHRIYTLIDGMKVESITHSMEYILNFMESIHSISIPYGLTWGV